MAEKKKTVADLNSTFSRSDPAFSAPRSSSAGAMPLMLDAAGTAPEAETPQRQLTNDEMLGLALISLATPLAGGLLGGREGAMAGGVSGLKAASGAASQIGERNDKEDQFKRAQGAKASDRQERFQDAVALEGIKAELKPEAKSKRQVTKNAKGQPIDAETGEVIDDSEMPMKPAAVKGPGKAPTSKPPPEFKGEDDLRRDYNKHPTTQYTNKVETAYAAVKSATPTPAGDLSLIFQFMKMLDPTSAVKEGEFANAQNAASVPDRVRNQYNKVMNGERLNDDQRKGFTTEAEALMTAQRGRQIEVDDYYSGLAKKRKLDPSSVVMPGAKPEVVRPPLGMQPDGTSGFKNQAPQVGPPPPPAKAVDAMDDKELDAEYERLKGKGLIK